MCLSSLLLYAPGESGRGSHGTLKSAHNRCDKWGRMEDKFAANSRSSLHTKLFQASFFVVLETQKWSEYIPHPFLRFLLQTFLIPSLAESNEEA